jgi:hypothetical protein
MLSNSKAGESVAGSCLCGTLKFEIRLPSEFCAHCHCSNCRRAHGATFVTWVGFQKKQVKVTSGLDCLHRYLTDTGAVRSFCGQCGSTVFYEGPRWPGELHVARANIRGEIDRAPTGHYYVDHRASWWTITDALPQYGGETGVEKKASQQAT